MNVKLAIAGLAFVAFLVWAFTRWFVATLAWGELPLSSLTSARSERS